jgi:hypothetical protein
MGLVKNTLERLRTRKSHVCFVIPPPSNVMHSAAISWITWIQSPPPTLVVLVPFCTSHRLVLIVGATLCPRPRRQNLPLLVFPSYLIFSNANQRIVVWEISSNYEHERACLTMDSVEWQYATEPALLLMNVVVVRRWTMVQMIFAWTNASL